MLDRTISKKLKGKVLRKWVTPARLYGLETVALTEQQQHKLQGYENNWVRRMTRTKRVDRRDERPKERGWGAMQHNRKIGEKQDEMGRPLGKDGCKQTSKESRGEKHQGRRNRGRPQVIWEDCVRRDMRRSGEEERWREGTADRKLWKERTERVARQYFT